MHETNQAAPLPVGASPGASSPLRRRSSLCTRLGLPLLLLCALVLGCSQKAKIRLADGRTIIGTVHPGNAGRLRVKVIDRRPVSVPRSEIERIEYRHGSFTHRYSILHTRDGGRHELLISAERRNELRGLYLRNVLLEDSKIVEIDHPGNVAATIGTPISILGWVVTALALRPARPACEPGHYCIDLLGAVAVLGIVMANVGTATASWGFSTWGRSTTAAATRSTPPP